MSSTIVAILFSVPTRMETRPNLSVRGTVSASASGNRTVQSTPLSNRDFFSRDRMRAIRFLKRGHGTSPESGGNAEMIAALKWDSTAAGLVEARSGGPANDSRRARRAAKYMSASSPVSRQPPRRPNQATRDFPADSVGPALSLSKRDLTCWIARRWSLVRSLDTIPTDSIPVSEATDFQMINRSPKPESPRTLDRPPRSCPLGPERILSPLLYQLSCGGQL